MRKFTSALLASAALLSTPALAETGAATAAATAMAEAADDSADAIVVFGKGETRQVQEVASSDIVILTPGTSPLTAR